MKTILQELAGIASNMNNPSQEPMSQDVPAAKDSFTRGPGTQGYLDLGGKGVYGQGGEDSADEYRARFKWFKHAAPGIEEAAYRGLASDSPEEMRNAFREILYLITSERDFQHDSDEK